MQTGLRNLSFTRGDDYEHVISFVADDETTPLNLAGSVFAAQLRLFPNAPDFTEFTVDGSGLASGVLALSLTAVQTALLTGNYQWDLQQTDSDVVTTVLAGQFSVAADVTREP